MVRTMVCTVVRTMVYTTDIIINLYIMKKKIRKLTRTSRNSRYIILPKEFLDDLGWREKQKLTVERVRGGILIKDWRKK